MKNVLALAVLVLWPSLIWAEGYPDLSKSSKVKRDGANDVAVIVAIEDYLLLPDVAGAVRNANDWEVFFRHSLGMKNVHMLVNAGASREDILAATRSALADSRKDGRVWFVFIGHGAAKEDGSDGVLVGMDAKGTASSLDARGIRRAELLDLLSTGKQKQTVAILDACFSGRTSSGALAPGVQPVVAVPRLKRADTVVFSAAKGDQVAGSLPNDTRPAFSYLTLGALRGWADTPDDKGKPDGAISAAEVEQYVARELRLIPGRTQVPDLSGDGNLLLTREAKESAPDLGPAMSPTASAAASRFAPTAKPSHEAIVGKSQPTTKSRLDELRASNPEGHEIYDSLQLAPKESITRADISDVMRKKRQAIQACADSKTKGKVTLRFSVRPDGQTHNIKIEPASTNTKLSKCLEGVLGKATFPKTSASKDTAVSYPIVF